MTRNALIPISEHIYFFGSGGQSSFVETFYQGRYKKKKLLTDHKVCTKKKRMAVIKDMSKEWRSCLLLFQVTSVVNRWTKVQKEPQLISKITGKTEKIFECWTENQV